MEQGAGVRSTPHGWIVGRDGVNPRRGIISFGSYLPVHRLRRPLISAALGVVAGEGERAVAGYDEDTTTLGVEAARAALSATPSTALAALHSVSLSTARPAYLDKTNATAIHAALGLAPSVAAYDMVGAVRSGIGALRAAVRAAAPALVVLSDVCFGRPGSTEERDGGDGAAALVCGPELPGAPVVAELIGSGCATIEVLHRWRLPSEPAVRNWDERFVAHAYSPWVSRAVADALDDAGTSAAVVDHLIVTGTHPRLAATLRRSGGFRPDAVVDDLASSVGIAGVAHPGILLTSVLERAAAGEVVVLVVIGDGAEVLVFRTTEAIESVSPPLTVEEQVAAGGVLSYEDFLTWRDVLRREPPRRPAPAPPAAPPALRSVGWKFGFTGSRCTECTAVHLPPSRVCRECRSVDHMEPVSMSNRQAVVATFAVDRLAYSPSPPLITAVLDFDGGGRFECEVTDSDPASLQIGDRMEMTFRRLFTVEGIHNYFWKARPSRGVD